jgi:hypothetical protein
MENEELKKENISERKLFVSIFLIIILAIGAFLIVYNWQQSTIKDKEDLIEAFNSNKELICFSKVVSISNGYKFDEKRVNFVTDGVNIFLISRCSLK